MASAKKKKKTANIIMVAVIVAAAAAGIAFTGYMKGLWSPKSPASSATSTDPSAGTGAGTGTGVEASAGPQGKSGANAGGIFAFERIFGNAEICRSGIYVPAKDGDRLLDGDVVFAKEGTNAEILAGDAQITAGENAEFSVSGGKLSLRRGEFFVNAGAPFAMEAPDCAIETRGGCFAVSLPAGCVDVYVCKGNVVLTGDAFGKRTVARGENLSLSRGLVFVEKTTGNELSSFVLSCAEEAGVSFVAGSKNRNKTGGSKRGNGSGKRSAGSGSKRGSAGKTSGRRGSGRRGSGKRGSGKRGSGKRGTSTKPTKPTNPTSPTKPTKPTKPTNPTSPTKPVEQGNTVTFSIICGDILKNKDSLAEGKSRFVPKDGCILPETKIEFEDGDSVFDGLKKVCEQCDIPLEYSWTPVYDSYYIEGINNLYEMDCGATSGWIYTVNGTCVNYGASSYELKKGDKVCWEFSCRK